MNKFLKIAIVVVLCLIVILTVTLFACQGQDPNSSSTTTTTTTTTTGGNPSTEGEPTCTEHVDADGNNKCDNCDANIASIDPECTQHTDANGDNKCDNCDTDITSVVPECTKHTDANGDEKCDNCGADIPNQGNIEDETGFTRVNDTIYIITGTLNVRTSPEIPEGTNNISKDIVAKFGNAFNRTGYNDEWTRLNIDGVEYYVKSDYVSTNKPTTEFDESAGRETVYIVNVASSINIRSITNLKFSTSVITALPLGEELVRLGVAREPDADGIVWAKVEVKLRDGTKTIGYVNNNYLSTEKMGTSNDMGIIFENNNDILEVVGNSSLNLRKVPVLIDGEGDAEIEKIAVPVGTTLQRIGIATQADSIGIVWSKVIFEGQIYYVSSKPDYVKVVVQGDDEGKVANYFNCFEIALPSTYVTMERDTYHYFLATPDGSASVSIEYSGDTLLSEKQVVEQLIKDMKLEGIVTPRVHSGVVYFDFEQIETSSNKITYTVVAVVNASEHTYYTLIFKEIGTREEIQSSVFKYMESIRLING